MKGRILFTLTIHAMIATACVDSKNKKTDQNELLVMADKTAKRALQLAGANRNNPDLLVLMIKLIDGVIVSVDQSQTSDDDRSWFYHILYGRKSQIQCRQEKFDTALAILDSVEVKYGAFWINWFLKAVISDFTGGTASANLNYEKVIDCCDSNSKETDQNTQEYLSMLVTCITAKVNGYGKEAVKEDIETLRARKDYTEGSPAYHVAIGFEDWGREVYLKSLWGIKE